MEYIRQKLIFFSYPAICFFLSFWAWRILYHNVPVFIIVFILSLSFFAIYHGNSNFLLKLYSIAIFITLIVMVLPWHLDKSIWEKGFLDITKINTRRSYYPNVAGSIFQNKYNYSLDKYENNLTTLLDPNFYFFASHPRERVGIVEFEKFSPIFIVFFLIGITQLFRKKIFLSSAIPLLILSAFIDQNYTLGPVFILPIFIATIAIGIKKSVTTSKNYLKI